MNNVVLEQLKQEYNETLKRAQDIGEIIANCIDIDTSHCGQDTISLAAYGDNLEQLIGARVRLFHTPGHKCEECPYKIKSDGSACKYHKVELISGHFICLAEPEQDKPPVISFDEEEGNVMDDIREKTEDFMDYLDSVVTNKKEQ